ncbi:extended synaptotagmin-1 [Xenopus tropicalis]|uniref:Extended synaptotagmin-1 n=1 Tax=Xenopus tropicalis TaxID=8364 RepID=A0A8J1JH86_XENTR|nr:extended synaptotagmin-1 [Xenopus tropicalis]
MFKFVLKSQFISRLLAEKYVLILVLSYFLGCLQFKIGYVILILLVLKCYMLWRSRRRPTEKKTEEIPKEKKKAPGRVPGEHFERSKSLNAIFENIWPYLTEYLETMLRQKIQPKIRSSSKYLASLRFINIDFGDKPPEVTALRAHGDPERKQIILDLEISYDTEVKIDIGFNEKTPIAGVKSIKLEGTLRIILAPLMEDAPLFGAITFYFPHRPVLDLRWIGLTHLLNIPGLHTMSDKKIVNKIAKFMVAPQHFSQRIKAKFDLNELHFKEPRIVLRIHVIEAKNLRAKDLSSSDPYVVIHGGGTTVQTKVIQKNLNPQWNETFEILYTDLPGQEVEFNLFNKDKELAKDQPLGSCKIRIADVPERMYLDKWIQLENAESGQLHIKLERLQLLSDPTKLEEVLKENEQTQTERRTQMSSAVLYTFIEKARGLPVVQVQKGKLNPLAVVQVAVQDSVQETGSKVKNGEVEWKRRFQFLLRNPLTEELKLMLHDERQKPLGCVAVPLSQLVDAADMTIEDWLPLESTEENRDIRVKLQLRILAPHPYSVKEEEQIPEEITRVPLFHGETKAQISKRKSWAKVRKLFAKKK